MISPEIIRRYPFFAGLNHEQIVKLAQSASELSVDTGHVFFHEGDELCCFHLVLEGAVAIVIPVPAKSAAGDIAGQLTGDYTAEDLTISTVGTGDIFSWSALVPPYLATAGARAIMPSLVIALDCQKLLKEFESDCRFGYLMMQKAAQISRDRLRDLRIESLAELAG
ncbi:MAG TPA: Crp/Fnr family transcriptional regulator [Anaerolineae bacterium]|nr:Crp/Fnr family transcriptional regulator [Anaerolineae bacterium]